MCVLCDRLRNGGKIDITNLLVQIGAAMQETQHASNGKRRREHLDALLNKALGIQESDTDQEADETWERARRS